MKFAKHLRELFVLTLAVIVFLSFFPTKVYSQEWRVYNLESGLPNNSISSLAVDSQEIWIGMTPKRILGAPPLPGGLGRFDGVNWTFYTPKNSGLPDDWVQALVVDEQENVWISVFELVKFDGVNWIVYPEVFDITALYTIDTLLWIGTGSGNIAKFDGINWKVYDVWNYGLPIGMVSSFVVDSQENLWYGCISPECGLVKFDGVNWTFYTEYTDVFALAADSQGNLWIGTWNNGLTKFDGSSWTVFNEENSELPSDMITSLTVDSENIWIGTSDGLAKFDGSSWTVFNEENSELPSNDITALAIDSRGNLWIATQEGLAVYREGGVILPGVSVEENNNTKPSVFSLQNYPNPFNNSTTIRYDLPEDGFVKITIYNMLGEEVICLKNSYERKGYKSVNWDASIFSSGVYFYRLETGEFVETQKMLLMK